MDDRLLTFLRPLYQDLDGISRLDDIERVTRLARRIYEPATPIDAGAFELLLAFHGLGKWLDRVGNISRTVLVTGVITEEQLRRTASSIRRLETPVTLYERAVAGARLIDSSGVRGLAQRFGTARREGQSLLDVVREAVADGWIPEWMPPAGVGLLEKRLEARRRFCSEILEELE